MQRLQLCNFGLNRRRQVLVIGRLEVERSPRNEGSVSRGRPFRSEKYVRASRCQMNIAS